jgi:carbon storage regulator
MLVLDRKVQEGFWIEGRIYVKVLAIGRRRVKLGIQAPSDSPIVREELRARLTSAVHNDGGKPSAARAAK